MASTNNIMPRLALKRAFMDIIAEELKLSLNVESTKIGYETEVQCWITSMEESFSRIRGGNAVSCDLNITFQLFSTINETGVHKGIMDLMMILPTHERLAETGIQITDISPLTSSTTWDDESSDGGVIGLLTLNLKYIARL
ncbi:hypothetical protein F0A71_10410 [Salmonella enterica]|uniref:Phage tail protein n=1 Tax=Salmonella muenchen TaxID=596 RepID=A0A735FPP3_SALMU|nr:hypothetical protein [Salmonella enterica]EKR1608662.1 hypothetical protein [Salmonella enterica subsp. enterica serovar Muenchen]ELJ2788463.1 hypothetical protein [Salmonella enterica subsp. enterica]ECQ3868518.1 hypothetical protein [Salmonella enterica]ECX4004882.1 hypothetical protein [Salmonella enterica]